MKFIWHAFCALLLALSAQLGRADAGDVTETLRIAWESFWHSSGYPRSVFKWVGPIRVKFSGDSVNRHKEFALRQLQSVAEIAGIEVIEVANDDASANFEVEFFANMNSLPANRPCDSNYSGPGGTIVRARIRANEPRVWRCMLHESMHTMGFSGHPHANSVLTYFGRPSKLTEADLLILRSVYSSDIKPGMFPFLALAIIARRLVETIPPGAERAEAEQAAQAFLRNTVKQMEDFAGGSGEPPVILLRSSRATSPGVARGRTEMQYYLGMAYSFGHIVEVDKKKGVEWLTKAAQADRAAAQYFLGEAYFHGRGIDADPVEGYKWYALAAQRGVNPAKKALEVLETRLLPEQISEGKTRAAEWRQTKSPDGTK